jgi:hypothetical protein
VGQVGTMPREWRLYLYAGPGSVNRDDLEANLIPKDGLAGGEVSRASPTDRA